MYTLVISSFNTCLEPWNVNVFRLVEIPSAIWKLFLLDTYFVCRLGMLDKKIMLIFCLRKTEGGGGGGKIKIVFKVPKMSSIYIRNLEKSSSFSRLWRQWVEGWAAFWKLSREDKIWALFFNQASLKIAIYWYFLKSYQTY